MESVFPYIGPKIGLSLRSTGTQGSAKPRGISGGDIAESIRERRRNCNGNGVLFACGAAGEPRAAGGPHLPCRSQDRAHDPLVPGAGRSPLIAADRGARSPGRMAVSRGCSRRTSARLVRGSTLLATSRRRRSRIARCLPSCRLDLAPASRPDFRVNAAWHEPGHLGSAGRSACCPEDRAVTHHGTWLGPPSAVHTDQRERGVRQSGDQGARAGCRGRPGRC